MSLIFQNQSRELNLSTLLAPTKIHYVLDRPESTKVTFVLCVSKQTVAYLHIQQIRSNVIIHVCRVADRLMNLSPKKFAF